MPLLKHRYKYTYLFKKTSPEAKKSHSEAIIFRISSDHVTNGREFQLVKECTKVIREQDIMWIALDGLTEDVSVSLVLKEFDYGQLKGSFRKVEHGYDVYSSLGIKNCPS